LTKKHQQTHLLLINEPSQKSFKEKIESLQKIVSNDDNYNREWDNLFSDTNVSKQEKNGKQVPISNFKELQPSISNEMKQPLDNIECNCFSVCVKNLEAVNLDGGHTTRRPFTKEEKEYMFNKAKEVPGLNPAYFRVDRVGNLIYKDAYGKIGDSPCN
jgi:hypothetical protein